MSQPMNYFPQPMMNPNPYQNNFNQPMQMQNPYIDRMNQLQQYQQNLQMQQPQMTGAAPAAQPIGLNCRIVDDFNAITANDVPMDGNGAVFMKRDGSQLQWRNWAANGTIVTTAYLPVIDANNEQNTSIPQNDFTALNEDVKALREEISARFDKLEKSMGGSYIKPTASKAKKGDTENE